LKPSLVLSLLDTRTPTLIKLGTLLEKEGFDIFYFSNEPCSSILNQKKMIELNINDQCDINSELISKFSTIYKNDRSLSYYINEKKAMQMMQAWYENSVKFIISNGINYCLIEGTPAHELVFELACIDNNVAILNFFHAPGPRGWSLVSRSSVEYPLYKNSVKDLNYLNTVTKVKGIRKVYVDVSERKITKLFRFLKRKRNYNYYPKHIILVKAAFFPLSYLLSKLLERMSGPQSNHVFYLHMEPERTVSNCGSLFTNQLEAIKCLTYNCDLHITLKEHPDWIGKRPISFLFQALINPKINYKTVLTSQPKLAWTFSGSIAWERTQNELPTMALGNTYLQKSLYVRSFPEIADSISKQDDDFFNFISDYVFEGELFGENLNPEVSEPANLNNLLRAIKICTTT